MPKQGLKPQSSSWEKCADCLTTMPTDQLHTVFNNLVKYLDIYWVDMGQSVTDTGDPLIMNLSD